MKLSSTHSLHLLTALLLPAPFALMGISQCCSNPDQCEDNDGDDWTEAQGDCNDADASINPSAVELCNGIDENCDGSIDEGTTVDGYYDADGDGVGSGDLMTVCSDVPVASKGGDCNDADGTIYPGAMDSCEDGIDQDCSGSDAVCGSSSEVAFTDTTGDDVSSSAVYDLFAYNTLSSTDYISFAISGSSVYDGAWCAENAAWYQQQYLTYYNTSGYSLNSGSWNKWYRVEGGSWAGPTTAEYTNYYGPYCDGFTYSWCSEWGINGMYNGIMPARTDGYGESFAGNWSYGDNWKVEIRVGSDRMSVCGF
jgi:hypothetical protein